MKPINVSYDDHRTWGTPNRQDNRPYAEIVLHGKLPTRFVRILALIDTGADYIQVNDSFAANLGINLQKEGILMPIQTAAGGQTAVTRIQNLEVEFEGKRIKADCLFGKGQIPLFGRVALLTLMDVGFDVRGWLFKK